MNAATPPDDDDPKQIERRRAEVLRLLDTVFPEIRATLPVAQVQEVLDAIEDEQIQLRNCDHLKALESASMATHFFVAAILWRRHWEQLLAPAVQTRLRALGATSSVNAKQIFETASLVDPPRPKSASDSTCWLYFVDAIVQKVRQEVGSAPPPVDDPDALRLHEQQENFVLEFRRRLQARVELAVGKQAAKK